MISDLMSQDVLLILIILPILSTLLVYCLCRIFLKEKWKAIHITVQATAGFYVIAVVLMLEKFINKPIIGLVLIILILVLSIILIFQWKNQTEVILRKGLKLLARISFLLFGFVYLLLVSYEIYQLLYIHYLN